MTPPSQPLSDRVRDSTVSHYQALVRARRGPGGRAAGWVYFAEAEGNRFRDRYGDLCAVTKVGFARNVERRLAALQTYSPDHIAIRAIVPGTLVDEHTLHDALRRNHLSHRAGGRTGVRGREWYDLPVEWWGALAASGVSAILLAAALYGSAAATLRGEMAKDTPYGRILGPHFADSLESSARACLHLAAGEVPARPRPAPLQLELPLQEAAGRSGQERP